RWCSSGASGQFRESLLRDGDVSLRDFLGLFLERMQHVYTFLPTGDVHHAIGSGAVPHTQFLDTPTNGRHRFEIIRRFAALQFFQLIAGIVTYILWKLSQAFQR